MKEEVEALLFSAGRKMEVEELSKLCKSSPSEITKSLGKIKKDYEERNSPLMVVQEGTSWKLTVSEKYLHLVQKIVTETELSKTIMETLAVIAWKHPALQSDVIKIRTNKAYEHLKELEEIGYITRAREGRSKKIRLTQKFFDYFDLPKEELGKKFENVNEIAQVIEAKEAEIEKIKAEAKEETKKAKEKSSQDNPEVDLIDKEGHKQKLEVVDETKIKPTQEELDNLKAIPDKEMLGKLEVVDEKGEKSSAPEDDTTETEDEQPEPEEEPEPIEAEPEENKEKESDDNQDEEEKPKPKRYGKGIKLPKEQQDIVDKRVEEIMNPPKGEQEEKEKTETSEKEEKPEPDPWASPQEKPKGKKNKKGKNKKEEEPVDLLEASSNKKP
jgi:segregation and condensation protein B